MADAKAAVSPGHVLDLPKKACQLVPATNAAAHPSDVQVLDRRMHTLITCQIKRSGYMKKLLLLACINSC